MKILLVEDDLSNSMTLSAVMEDEGHQVEASAFLAEARGKLEPGRFACVVLDRSLSDGDGLTLLEPIRAMKPAPAVVIMTGDRAGLPPGLDVMGVFSKGEDLSMLLQMLRMIADLHR